MTGARLLASVALATVLFALPTRAQETASTLERQGASYFIYTEMGAPSFEMFVVGEGVRNGIYRLQEGTTLTELVALSGGVPTSEETERQIVRAQLRVLREQGGVRVAIYEATTEQAIREPAQHPRLEGGDVLELDVTYEDLGEPFTFRDAIEVAARVASLISVAILLYTRIN